MRALRVSIIPFSSFVEAYRYNRILPSSEKEPISIEFLGVDSESEKESRQ